AKTVKNSDLPKTDETFFGLRFRWTARPVKFAKKNLKQNLVTQMTQPVRRRYEVLLERSTGGFQNRARGI
ncbi:inverse autotransporter beta domain-containing protein, partial [Prochlorococcus marinus]